MNKSAEDFREAWNIAKAFLDDTKETYLMLSVGTIPSTSHYKIVKLPYGKNIFLLYCLSWHDAELCPGIDLKYSGFYSRANEQTYDIREPLTRFFGFDRDFIHEITLKNTVIEAIQRSVTEHIASHVEEFSGISITNQDDVTSDVEKAFSKKETNIDFAKKITISEWSISNRDMVDFIDDPESLLRKKTENRIKGHEEELARLWVAHCASQKILDQLYTEYSGGSQHE